LRWTPIDREYRTTRLKKMVAPKVDDDYIEAKFLGSCKWSSYEAQVERVFCWRVSDMDQLFKIAKCLYFRQPFYIQRIETFTMVEKLTWGNWKNSCCMRDETDSTEFHKNAILKFIYSFFTTEDACTGVSIPTCSSHICDLVLILFRCCKYEIVCQMERTLWTCNV
jgi:hypothetical protein